jgi:hypothetical protein
MLVASIVATLLAVAANLATSSDISGVSIAMAMAGVPASWMTMLAQE